MIKKLFQLLTFVALTACGPAADRTGGWPMADGDTVTARASLLTLTDHDGFSLGEIRNPWDSTAAPLRIALVDRDATVPELAEDVTIVRVPVESTVVCSEVHLDAVKSLAGLDAVAGVTDVQYITDPEVKRLVREGRIADCNTAVEPSVEQLLNLTPDAVLTVPYADSDHSALDKMHIPMIQMADYMETTPLGRAEWLKLIGRLYGRKAQADSIVEAVAARYTTLRELAAKTPERPKVLTEQLTSGVWYVPGGGSYMARIIADAGAHYPFGGNHSTGSVPLDFPAVIDKAADADFWLLKVFGSDVTRESLRADNPLYAELRPWQEGNIYVARTDRVNLFGEFPFHPELLLNDYMLIFHPELAPQLMPARYFFRID